MLDRGWDFCRNEAHIETARKCQGVDVITVLRTDGRKNKKSKFGGLVGAHMGGGTYTRRTSASCPAIYSVECSRSLRGRIFRCAVGRNYNFYIAWNARLMQQYYMYILI